MTQPQLEALTAFPTMIYSVEKPEFVEQVRKGCRIAKFWRQMGIRPYGSARSTRRATARIHPDGRVEFRSDPEWFTDYYRREGVE